MSKKVKNIEKEEIKKDVVSEVVDEPIDEPIDDTPGKIAYRKFIEEYKKQNPVKYEQKKEAFDRRLRGDIELIESKSSRTKTFKFLNTPEK